MIDSPECQKGHGTGKADGLHQACFDWVRGCSGQLCFTQPSTVFPRGGTNAGQLI